MEGGNAEGRAETADMGRHAFFSSGSRKKKCKKSKNKRFFFDFLTINVTKKTLNKKMRPFDPRGHAATDLS